MRKGVKLKELTVGATIISLPHSASMISEERELVIASVDKDHVVAKHGEYFTRINKRELENDKFYVIEC